MEDHEVIVQNHLLCSFIWVDTVYIENSREITQFSLNHMIIIS